MFTIVLIVIMVGVIGRVSYLEWRDAMLAKLHEMEDEHRDGL